MADKGFARTTSRDIANTAGVSLAAIGYHFGSTVALLNTALIEAMGGGATSWLACSQTRSGSPTTLTRF